MDYVVLEVSGKQYFAAKGVYIVVDLINGLKNTIKLVKNKIKFNLQPMFVKEGELVLIGDPYVQNYTVKCIVTEIVKDKKIKSCKPTGVIFGHRTKKAKILVEDILRDTENGT